MIVEVYWNLRKHTWSVRAKKTHLVIDHKDSILLKDAILSVKQGGRNRVLRDQQKNVHAFAIGTVKELDPIYNISPLADNYKQVIYNPYKYNSFVIADTEEPIYEADHVYLTRQWDTIKQIYHSKVYV